MLSVVQHTSVYTCVAAEQALLSNGKRCNTSQSICSLASAEQSDLLRYIPSHMLKRSHSVAHGFLSCVFASVFSRTCLAVLAIRCMAGLQLSTAVAHLSTAAAHLSTAVAHLSTAVAHLSTTRHSRLLPGTVVYYQAQLSTTRHNCLLLELSTEHTCPRPRQALPALTVGFRTWTD